MAERWEVIFPPSDRVLWQEEGGRNTWLVTMLVPALMGFFSGLSNSATAVSTTFLSILLMLLILRAATSGHSGQDILTYVTERHIRHSKSVLDVTEQTEIPVADVRAVEVFAHALRITQRNGKVVVLDDMRSAAEAGVALARAAGLPPPRVPAPVERLAEETVYFGGMIGTAFGFALAFRTELVTELAGPSVLLTIVLFLVALLALGALGALAGLLALKPLFDRDQMHAWMWQSEIFGPNPHRPAELGTFRAACLLFVDLVFDAPDAPPDTGETGDG